MHPTSDVAVIGAGIVGLSAAYALQRSGQSVMVYDSGPPGGGQSVGASRLFRHAHDDPRMVDLAVEARVLWDRWSAEFGTRFISADGSIALGEVAAGRVDTLRSRPGIPVRNLSGDELRSLMPILAPYDGPAVFEEAGIYGVAHPDRSAFGLGIAREVETNEPGGVANPDALAELIDRAAAYVAKALPGLDPEPLQPISCWITTVPWGDDGVAIWQADHIFVLAGHNLFKHAPVLGETLAQSVTAGSVPELFRPESRLGGD